MEGLLAQMNDGLARAEERLDRLTDPAEPSPVTRLPPDLGSLCALCTSDGAWFIRSRKSVRPAADVWFPGAAASSPREQLGEPVIR
jgi:hypothetical protein